MTKRFSLSNRRSRQPRLATMRVQAMQRINSVRCCGTTSHEQEEMHLKKPMDQSLLAANKHNRAYLSTGLYHSIGLRVYIVGCSGGVGNTYSAYSSTSLLSMYSYVSNSRI